MTRNDIVTLFDYDRWATDRQLAAISKLSEEQYSRDLGSSMGGIHGTLVHILGAQEIWLSRWMRKTPGPLANPQELTTLAALVPRWSGLREACATYLAILTEAELQQPLEYRMLNGTVSSQPLWQQMQHVANHSTYHRGQITTMLRQLGAAPVGTDLVTFYRETAK